MTELVQQNLGKAQKQQKVWYDLNARSRELKPGDDVLVLLPTAATKLFAQWQGPYKVTRNIGKVNYELDMSNRRKRKRILHINLLRKWHTPVEVNYLAMEDDSDDWDSDVPAWNSGDSELDDQQSVIIDRLTPDQMAELRQILEEFSDVLRNEPGRTDLAEHKIETGSARPLRQPPVCVANGRFRPRRGSSTSQVDEKGEEHPVGFFSRKVLPREEKYTTVEKECLAIRLGVEAFWVYLLGKPFIIQSDHRSLEWLNRMKESNLRLTRWSPALQPYKFEVRYIAGRAPSDATN